MAIEQIADLTSSGNKADANLIRRMIDTSQAVWFTKGTPKTVLQDVRNTVSIATDKGQVPILVAYNIPFRDCSQYSAGDATSVADYEAWIDAFAAGIGKAKAVVLLEPDGLGIIPWYNPFGDRDTWTTKVNPNDFSTWGYTDQWYTKNVESQTWWYTEDVLKHFVIDSSRNGQGPWTAPADHPAGDPQTWCNPPDRGLGLRPTANTEVPLVDAYLWVKIPGESDGQCYRWTTGPTDPVRGTEDPAAGQWFADMARELVHNANPPLK